MLGNRIKELRLQNNLTQQQLGDKVHVTKTSICCYEKGERVPSLDILLALSEVLKVDLNTLVGYDKYIVSDNDVEYGINVSKEELKLILELRKHNALYSDLITSPKRTLAAIEKKY